MKKRIVKDLMVPVSEYATISEDATLYEAAIALEKTPKDSAQRTCPHRALLVLDKKGVAVGRLSHWDVLKALEPKYAQMGDMSSISRAGFSPSFVETLMSEFALWDKPLLDICTKAAKLKVKSFMYTPGQGEYVDENASLDQAIHMFVMGHHRSLLVTREEAIVGILILAEAFQEICEVMKTCKI